MDSLVDSGKTMTLDSTSLNLLQQAAQWRLIGLLFERPDDHWLQQVTSLAGEVADPQLHSAAVAAQTQASVGLYDTTFGPGGPACPRLVSYRQCLDPGQFLSQLRDFYNAFAYKPVINEPADHIAVQCGFVSYLLLKQLYAQLQGEHDRAAVAAQAASSFIQEFLANMAEPLACTLKQSGIEYLNLASSALLRLTGPKPKGIDTSSSDSDQDCLTCCQ